MFEPARDPIERQARVVGHVGQPPSEGLSARQPGRNPDTGGTYSVF